MTRNNEGSNKGVEKAANIDDLYMFLKEIKEKVKLCETGEAFLFGKLL